jgi:hypothetical protein
MRHSGELRLRAMWHSAGTTFEIIQYIRVKITNMDVQSTRYTFQDISSSDEMHKKKVLSKNNAILSQTESSFEVTFYEKVTLSLR